MQGETIITQLLLDQIGYLKKELEYYRDEFARMQEICLGKREVEDDIPKEDRIFEPLQGSLTPSQKRRILERQSRAKAREKELETTSIEG